MKFSWPSKCRKWTVVWFEWPGIEVMEGGRKRRRRLVILAWRQTLIQQEGPIKHNLFSLSLSKKALNLAYSPNWFHRIYRLLYSPVYQPQDYDATLACISVKIQWEQQERPLPHSNPQSWECSMHALACLTKKIFILPFTLLVVVRDAVSWSVSQDTLGVDLKSSFELTCSRPDTGDLGYPQFCLLSKISTLIGLSITQEHARILPSES